MKYSGFLAVLLGASIAVCQPSWAIDLDYSMPSNHYDELNAKLIQAGFSEVRVVDLERNKVVAFDIDGSEVVMIVDPKTHRILSSAYAHHFDD